MRPVPVVFLRLAFSPQLTATCQLHCSSCTGLMVNLHLRVLAAGYPHEEQVCFWMWRERRPASKSVSGVLSSCGTDIFHCCERRRVFSHTATTAQRVRLVVALSEAGGTLRCIAVSLAVSGFRRQVGFAYSSCGRGSEQQLVTTQNYEGRGRHTC